MYPYHINDPEFAEALVDSFMEICSKNPTDSSLLQVASCESSQDLQKGHDYNVNSSSSGTLAYSPSNFPDARPGWIIVKGALFLYKVLVINNMFIREKSMVIIPNKFSKITTLCRNMLIINNLTISHII